MKKRCPQAAVLLAMALPAAVLPARCGEIGEYGIVGMTNDVGEKERRVI